MPATQSASSLSRLLPQHLDKLAQQNPAQPLAMPGAARLLIKVLNRIEFGSLTLVWPDQSISQFGHDHHLGHDHAIVQMTHWQTCQAVLQRGDIGLAESFIDGHWHTPDLEAVLRVGILNRQKLENLFYGSWLGGLLYRLRHWSNRNSKSGSRKNIHAHYDLGNDFYQLWLDASMTYSSALFTAPDQSLEQAQHAKYQRLLDELALDKKSKVLEIGCGWGGFAELAAKAGMHVTGLTLSTEQAAFAKTRASQQGLTEKVDIKLQDYRDERVSPNERYDGIVSIEMFEAVGEAYWPSYFDCIRRNLATHGKAAIQTIVIDAPLFERYRKSSDFIQQYIFPGGMLPSISAFEKAAAAAGLKVINQRAFGQDYATTLRHWLHRFDAQLEQVKSLGFDDRFIHTWRFYLCYCAAAFALGNCNVVQFTLVHAEL